jgi:uncharacterized coiled-coil DUF342 family protein
LSGRKKMDKIDLKILEICERTKSLEQKVNNGLSEDIKEIKQNLSEINTSLKSLEVKFSGLKNAQTIQWFFITAIFMGLLAIFLKR